MKPAYRVLSVLVVLGGLFLAYRAYTYEQAAAEARRNERPADPSLARVSGFYYMGDGLGANRTLRVSSGGGFTFDCVGCTGPCGKAKGWAGLRDGRLLLRPETQSGAYSVGTEYVPVPWSQRLYLVEADRLLEFCEDARRLTGWEPRKKASGFFYLREGDWQIPAKGPPAVPEPWSGFFADDALRSRVESVDEDGKATVDWGVAGGLRKGMELVAVARGRKETARVIVESVEAERAVVMPVSGPRVEKGWRVFAKVKKP